MVRALVEEAATLASLALFLGMIAIWAQASPRYEALRSPARLRGQRLRRDQRAGDNPHLSRSERGRGGQHPPVPAHSQRVENREVECPASSICMCTRPTPCSRVR